MQKIILLTGTRRVGKDTFWSLVCKYETDSLRFERFAFADDLKDECDSLCYSFFEKHIHELTPEEKEIFRPILITVGMTARKIDELFWVKKLVKHLTMFKKFFDGAEFVPIISDVRFMNEADYFINKYGKENVCLVGIFREDNPEPTEEEKIHAPMMEKYIDYRVNWPVATDNLSRLNIYVEDFYNYWIKKYGIK